MTGGGDRANQEPGSLLPGTAVQRWILLAFAGACAALLGPPHGRAQSGTEFATEASLRELHERVNEFRIIAGCPPLEWHEPTARVAGAHSEDMARRDYFDHVSPEGVDLVDRLLAGGVTWRGSVAENIALTVRGADVVIELWVDSPPHRANLEECTFTHHGLGLFRDRWTQVLVEDPAH